MKNFPTKEACHGSDLANAGGHAMPLDGPHPHLLAALERRFSPDGCLRPYGEDVSYWPCPVCAPQEGWYPVVVSSSGSLIECKKGGCSVEVIHAALGAELLEPDTSQNDASRSNLLTPSGCRVSRCRCLAWGWASSG